MQHKYIRFESLGIVMWPMTDFVTHADVAARFKYDLAMVSDKLVSAGFASIHNGTALCGGYSESLRLGHLKEDSEVLSNQLGLN